VTRFLVTGADGFVGTHLVAALRSAGHAVTGTTLSGGPDTVSCDVRSASEVNVTGTHNLLESLRREAPGARVLLACTSDQYGAVAPGDCPIEEAAPLRPLSPYAASKVAAEWVGRMFCNAFALQVVITRAFMHVGPGQPATFATADWARQIALAEAGGREPVLEVGNLDLAREYGDVRDVVEAYLAALESGEPGEPYNVATGDARPLREVVAILTRLARVEMEVRVDPSKIRPADPPVLEGSAAKLHRLTGWAPRRRLEDTLAEVLEHWRKVTAGAVLR
jgi:GDP-4-dehydro-6-deoxy-D-mannose reductase